MLDQTQHVVMPGNCPRVPIPPGRRPTKESKGQMFVNSKIASERYTRIGQKTMIGFFTLKNGHELVTSYQYTDAESFDEVVAAEQCRKQASKEIWELYSFYTQEAQHHIDDSSVDTGDIPYGPLKTTEDVIADDEARDILQQNIATAENLLQTDYTEASWNAMQIILSDAKRVVASYSSTLEEIYEINEALIDAMVALIPVEPEATI